MKLCYESLRKVPKVRWVMSYGFCSKFHMLSSSAKSLKIGYDLTKLQRD